MSPHDSPPEVPTLGASSAEVSPAVDAPASARFPKSARLLSGRDFTTVLRRGSVAADDTLVVFALPRPDRPGNRIGITIPKKTGNAVLRNRWKRLIREAYRTRRERFPGGFDFVVRPKKGAVAEPGRITAGLLATAKRAAKRASQQRASQ